MATTEISIKANLTQLRKELALIPGITDKEAKAMTQELIKELKKSEKAAKKAATGSKKAWQGYGAQVDKTSDSVNQFTDSAGDADSTLMGFAGVLDLVNPALGDMARVTGDVLAGTESLGKAIKFSNPIFIALGVAALALGAAYAKLSEDEKRAVEQAERLEEQQERTAAAHKKVSEVMRDLHRDFQEATGVITEFEATRQRSVQSAMKSLDGEIKAQEEAIEASKERLRLEEAKKGAWFSLDPDPKTLIVLRHEVVLEERRLETLKSQAHVAGDLASKTVQANEKKRKSTEAATAADEAAQAVLDAQKEAAQELAQSQASLGDIIKTNNADQLNKLQAIDVALQDQIDMIDQLIAKHPENAEIAIKAQEATTAAIEKASRDRYAVLREQDEEYADQRAKDEERHTKKNAEEADKRVEQELKAQQAIVDGLDMALGYTASLEQQAAEWSAKLSDEGAAQNLEAAKFAFNVSKAAALSSVAIETALAVMKITSQAGVFAPPLVAATLALGGSQAALIASEQPSFHAGGLIGHGGALNPDERNITARAGEGVVSQAGMARLGADGLDALNRGTGGGGQIIVTQQYQHRAFGAMVQRDIQLPNSPLRKALRGTGRVGHKSRSK